MNIRNFFLKKDKALKEKEISPEQERFKELINILIEHFKNQQYESILEYLTKPRLHLNEILKGVGISKEDDPLCIFFDVNCTLEELELEIDYLALKSNYSSESQTINVANYCFTLKYKPIENTTANTLYPNIFNYVLKEIALVAIEEILHGYQQLFGNLSADKKSNYEFDLALYFKELNLDILTTRWIKRYGRDEYLNNNFLT